MMEQRSQHMNYMPMWTSHNYTIVYLSSTILTSYLLTQMQSLRNTYVESAMHRCSAINLQYRGRAIGGGRATKKKNLPPIQIIVPTTFFACYFCWWKGFGITIRPTKKFQNYPTVALPSSCFFLCLRCSACKVDPPLKLAPIKGLMS